VENGQLLSWAPGKVSSSGVRPAVDLEGIGFSSLTYFHALYEANCLPLDRIFAWEAAPYDPADWWRHVPLNIRAKLTFFNLPVESRRGSLPLPMPGATGATGAREPNAGVRVVTRPAPLAADPLALIATVARPEDFVVLKVDIDGDPELELVSRVADDEGGIAALVDELYFEYHYYFDGLNFGWLTHRGGRNYAKWGNRTVDQALALMQRLRYRGVRAHFWV